MVSRHQLQPRQRQFAMRSDCVFTALSRALAENGFHAGVIVALVVFNNTPSGNSIFRQNRRLGLHIGRLATFKVVQQGSRFATLKADAFEGIVSNRWLRCNRSRLVDRSICPSPVEFHIGLGNRQSSSSDRQFLTSQQLSSSGHPKALKPKHATPKRPCDASVDLLIVGVLVVGQPKTE